jgi:hypothetical protein
MPLNNLEENKDNKGSNWSSIKSLESDFLPYNQSCYCWAEHKACRLHQCRTGKIPYNLFDSCQDLVLFTSTCPDLNRVLCSVHIYCSSILHTNCTVLGLPISSRSSTLGGAGFISRSGELSWLRHFVVFLTQPGKFLDRAWKQATTVSRLSILISLFISHPSFGAV